MYLATVVGWLATTEVPGPGPRTTLAAEATPLHASAAAPTAPTITTVRSCW